MKRNDKPENEWQGYYTIADCDCIYCLYYGGRRKGKVKCLAEKCICEEEIRIAKEKEFRRNLLWK